MTTEQVSVRPAGSGARAGLVLLVTSCAQFLVILDETVVNVALPSIGRDIPFANASSLAWIVDAYMLLFGGFLILGGRGADLFGRRRVFLTGLGLFVLASLSAATTSEPGVMVASRGMQGLGAALMSPAALSILVTAFTDPDARRRALGIWGGLAGISGVTGVVLGGVLTDMVSWRWIFLINVPIGLVLAAVAMTCVPADDPGRRRGSLDSIGAALVCGGLLLLVYSVISTSHRSWGDPLTVGGLVTAAVLLGLFVLRESRTSQPLIRLGLFGNRAVAVANVMMILAAASLYAVFFFITLYMQLVHQWSPLRSGLSFVPIGISIAIFSGVAIQLMPRIGGRALLVTGLTLAAAGQVLLLRTTPDGGYVAELLPSLLLCGCGYGLSLVPLVSAAVSGLRADETGAGSGLINTAQQVGGALGVAVLATIATSRFESALATSPAPEAMVTAFHAAFHVGAGLTVAAALVALLLPALRTEVDLNAMQGAADPATLPQHVTN
jgi:EmrB/QacA subfamily drug resistance transporter